MKNFPYHYATAIALTVIQTIILGACNNAPEKTASLQDTTTHPPLPCMWIDDNTSHDAEKHFLNDFNPILVNQIKHHETDSTFYTSNAFQQMIQYCKNNVNGIVYLDVYPAIAPPPNADTMTLLFVPKDAKLNTLGYYLKVTSGSPTFPQSDDLLKVGDFQDWTGRYAKRIAGLNNQLDHSDPGNYRHCDTSDTTQFSNSIYLHHRYSDFLDLVTEFTTQHDAYKTTVSGVKAFLSARPYVSGQRYSLSNRLYVIMEFTQDDSQGRHNVYSLQAQDPNRVLQKPCLDLYEKCAVTSPTGTPGANNGQMCPPTCTP